MGKADLKEHAEHESGSEVQEGKKSESWSCQQQQQQDGVMACSRPVGMFSILIRLGVALCYRLHLCTLSCSITIKKKKGLRKRKSQQLYGRQQGFLGTVIST